MNVHSILSGIHCKGKIWEKLQVLFWIPALRSATAGMTSLVAGLIIYVGCRIIVEINGSVQFKISGFSASNAFCGPLQAAASYTATQSERNSLIRWLDIHILILYINTPTVEQ